MAGIKTRVTDIKPFYFKDNTNNSITNKEFNTILDKDIPITLINNIDLVDRVHSRYPLLDKTDIAIIIKTVFESIRESLVICKNLSFKEFINRFYIIFYKTSRFGDIKHIVKTQFNTPKGLRKLW